MDIDFKFYDKEYKQIIVRKEDFDWHVDDSDWINNLLGKGYKPEYERLELFHDDIVPKDFYKTKLCFSLFLIDVEQYRTWYNLYQPFLNAGWVSRYEAWLYEKKAIVPYEDNVLKSKPSKNSDDYVWLEYRDENNVDGFLLERFDHVQEVYPEVKYVMFEVV